MEHRVDTPSEAAAVVRAHRALRIPGAIVLCQPVPRADALDEDILQRALDRARHDARRQGITGKSLTPFLLEAIHRDTAGRSLQANRALLIANARLAAEITGALAV